LRGVDRQHLGPATRFALVHHFRPRRLQIGDQDSATEIELLIANDDMEARRTRRRLLPAVVVALAVGAEHRHPALPAGTVRSTSWVGAHAAGLRDVYELMQQQPRPRVGLGRKCPAPNATWSMVGQRGPDVPPTADCGSRQDGWSADLRIPRLR